jgi:hypothetical protein
LSGWHVSLPADHSLSLQHFPAHVFTLAGPVDAHHDVARFSWGLGRGGDGPLVVGFDVATAGTDGRLARVVGFLDTVPT